MSDSNEKLSVIIDEYAGDEACQAVLDEVIEDVNLQYQLRRYQMIGDAMRHELPEKINLDLSHQIMAEIRKECSTVSDRSLQSTGESTGHLLWSWARLKPLAGFAVAASVAVVSVGLWQTGSIDTGQQPIDDSQVVSIENEKIEKLVNSSVQIKPVTVSSSLNEGTRWSANEDSPALQQKLNAYLVNHTEYSNSMQGLIPQARVAGFDSQQ